MAKISLELLKDAYLSDSNISTIDGLINEAIATIEEFLRHIEYSELYERSRPLAVAYIAL